MRLPVAAIRVVAGPCGEENLLPVFTETGEYMIYLAKNLETEPENTVSYETTVFYFHEDRPDR